MSVDPHVLQGLKVLSFCHYLQGPAASQYLADMGADVIKVEPPTGAFERGWAGANTFVSGVSAFFLCANRNKRSLAVDLKAPEGREIIARLIATADVLLENYRPGVMDRLGFGYDAVKAINPRIVYASASGYGSSGPDCGRPGQDLLIQARTGFMAASGDARVAPVPTGFAAADQHGGALLAVGILGAYVRALKTGVGTRVEGSLFNAGVDLQAEALTLYYSGRQNDRILERDPHLATWFHQAPYGVYRLVDAFVAISLNSLTSIERALSPHAPLGLPQADPYEERDRIAAGLATILAGWTFEELSAAFEAESIWYQRVQTYDDLKIDPQAVHNELFREIAVGEATATLVNHPLRYDGATPDLRHMALEPGAHTAEILAEVGLAERDIADLAQRGVITCNTAQGLTS